MMDRRRIYILFFVLLLSSFSLFFSHLFYHDDSYITLRYAQRLVDGKGLTWNDGERVEGFSNFLWLIQNALFGYIGVDLVLSSRYLGLAYYLAILAMLILSKVPSLWLIPLMTLPSLNLYAMSGMETVSFCFWLLAGTVLLNSEIERKKYAIPADDLINGRESRKIFIISGVLFAAGGLTRPEGVLVGILVLTYLFVIKMFSGAIRFAIGFFPPIFCYQLFRILYFRNTLPNTYFAKSAYVSKMILLKSLLFSLAKWSFDWIPLAILIFLALRRASVKKLILPAIVSFPVVMAYFVGGGDYFKGSRILLPAIIVLAYSAGQYFKSRKAAPGKGIFAVAVLVSVYQIFLSTVLWQMPVFPMTFGLKPRDQIACHGEIIGRFLEKNLPPGTLVGTNSAGALPYFASSLSFVDMLGLNDRVIARREIHELTTYYQKYPGHIKGNGAYVLSRSPDMIILGPAYGILKNDNGRLFLSDYEILKDDSFRKLYSPYQIELSITGRQREAWDWYEFRLYLKDGRYFIIVWLRKDSRKVDQLRNVGIELESEKALDGR